MYRKKFKFDLKTIYLLYYLHLAFNQLTLNKIKKN